MPWIRTLKNMYMLKHTLAVDIENIATAEARRGHLMNPLLLRIRTNVAVEKSMILIPV